MKRTKFPLFEVKTKSKMEGLRDFKFIRKIAWSFHHTTGVDFEELLSEAVTEYLTALKYYNPANSKKFTKASTYAYARTVHRLIDFTKEEGKYICSGLMLEKEGEESYYDPSYPEIYPQHVLSFIQILPKDLRKVARAAVSCYKLQELVNIKIDSKQLSAGLKSSMKPIPYKTIRGLLFRRLRSYGWPWSKIWEKIKKMKEVLNETKRESIII